MRRLLDTHLLIWAMGDPRRLGASLRERLDDPAHTLLISVASLWELVIKASLGHGGFQVEPPLLHRDPFDRMLLAQAVDEGLLLLTADAQLGRYPEPVEVVAADS